MIIGSNSKFVGYDGDIKVTIEVTDLYVAHYPRKVDRHETRTMVTFTTTGGKDPVSHTDHLETFLGKINEFHKVN